ncbi:MAG: hypothetical protein LQ351_002518 [Letrouitia transgressa]|nr:MAG: hypothetical protein LQ351_002518 [Letrouitia transgressa]
MIDYLKPSSQALIVNVARNPDSIQQAISSPPGLLSRHHTTSPHQISASVQADLVEEGDQQDEESDHQSARHPLSHLGAGRFWSSTKKPDSWMHRVQQLKRKVYWSDVNPKASEAPCRDLLAESATWLDNEYPINPEHITLVSKPHLKTEDGTSNPFLQDPSGRTQKKQWQQPARPETHQSITLFSGGVEERRQLEVIHKKTESNWIPSCRLTEVETNSLDLTELEWANIQESFSLDAQAPGDRFDQPDDTTEVRKSGCLGSKTTYDKLPVAFAPAPWGEGRSTHELSGLYDPPEIDGAFEVEDPLVQIR